MVKGATKIDYNTTVLGRAYLKSPMTMDELEKKSDVRARTIRRYLNRRYGPNECVDYKLGNLRRICKALGVDIREAILDYDEEE